ncbi:MAG: hypothetical protein SVY53_13475 [Chloroflexota bacterium]|nr:hypothetical protein [Chloroflexota bacterium]
MNYSEYWRVNKSCVDHTELANALRSLRKVVGEVGVDADAVWSGVPIDDNPRIELPLLLAMGDYPIPPERMDVLTGTAIHEALHIRENTQRAVGYLSQLFPRMKDKTPLMRLAQAGEDVHVNGVALQTGLLGCYVQKSRQWWRDNLSWDFTAGRPNLEGLLGIWTDIVLDVVFSIIPANELPGIKDIFAEREPGDLQSTLDILCLYNSTALFTIYGILLRMPQSYEEPLEHLLLNTPQIIDSDAEIRAIFYMEFWNRWEKTFNDWQLAIEQAGLSESSSMLSSSSLMDDEQVPPEITAAVAAALTGESKTITRQIEATLKALGGEHQRYRLFPTLFEDATMACKAVPHQRLVRRLSEVFHLQQEQAARINRGLRSGKLDKRRMYRVHTNGLIFKKKEYFPENNRWDITLLIDASSSVIWHWQLIESVYVAMAEALKRNNSRLEILAYKEAAGNCLVSRLFYGNSLFTTTTGGSTPSGEAIMAAALSMPRSQRRFVVHVTDGLWNSGIDVWYAIEHCKREGIDLVTLGCGDAIRALELQYGKSFEVIEYIEQLPKAMEDLFRKKMLGR